MANETFYKEGLTSEPRQTRVCEQALRSTLATGGKRKENLPLRLWNLNVEKVNVECCQLVEMTLAMMSLLLERFKLCFFFTFALISTLHLLVEI